MGEHETAARAADAGDTLSLAFQHDFSLKLGDAAYQIEEEPARGGASSRGSSQGHGGSLLLLLECR